VLDHLVASDGGWISTDGEAGVDNSVNIVNWDLQSFSLPCRNVVIFTTPAPKVIGEAVHFGELAVGQCFGAAKQGGIGQSIGEGSFEKNLD
jgi:hypothetical protein